MHRQASNNLTDLLNLTEMEESAYYTIPKGCDYMYMNNLCICEYAVKTGHL